MCGIVGYWASYEGGDRKSLLETALTSLARRGPDDRGIELWQTRSGEVGLGHARLSIIDLSSAGHQPMHSFDGRYSLVFNGEIYNYLELRDELMAAGYSFSTKSDTEVLLVAWTAWGKECLTKLIGMFAIAVLDREENTLTCVRDAFGIKPIFYTSTKDGFYFSSEISATVLIRGVGADLNLQRSYDYLVHGDYDSSSQTFIDGIYQLEPGEFFVFDINSGILNGPKRWWRPQVLPVTKINFKDAANEVRSLFLESIKQQLRSDVPLGAALSGGIDSSSVVCAMRHLQPDIPIHTFSFIAGNSSLSEEKWVDIVNREICAEPHKIFVDENDLANDLDDMILAQGEPFGSTSIYAQFRVFKAARETGIKVTLDGQGADELLAGYNGYPGHRVRSMVDNLKVIEAADFLRRWAKWPGRKLSHSYKLVVAEYVDGEFYQILRQFSQSKLRPDWLNIDKLAESGVEFRFPRVRPDSVPGRRLIAELGISATRRGLPALLRHADRNSMHFSVESRVPFLSTKLADFLFSLPEEYLVSRNGETKFIFREAMRGIVPDLILDRRDKIGFSTPEQDWLLRLGERARTWLCDESVPDILKLSKLLNSYDNMLSGGKPFSWQAWRWINFIRWYSLIFKPLSKLSFSVRL